MVQVAPTPIPERELTLRDIQRAAELERPDFVELVHAYLRLPDPAETEPEEGVFDAEGRRQPAPPVPTELWTWARHLKELELVALRPEEERKAAREESWNKLLANPFAPPRLRLGALFVELYQRDDAWSRAELLRLASEVRLVRGPWQGLKRIYKLAEERHDAEMFGVLAARIDRAHFDPADVSPATITYMRRRAWRFLRQLGGAAPALYVKFAVETMRHVPAGFTVSGMWTTLHIAGYGAMSAQFHDTATPLRSRKTKDRAFEAAWKESPAPLLDLALRAKNDEVAGFAIAGLEADFAEHIRALEVPTLVRLLETGVGPVTAFAVRLIKANPNLHPARFRELGLHEALLTLLELKASDAAVTTFAVEYARAHAGDLPRERLVRIATSGGVEAQKWALSKIAELAVSALPQLTWVALLTVPAAASVVSEKLLQIEAPKLELEAFLRLATGVPPQRAIIGRLQGSLPIDHWLRLLDDPRGDATSARVALGALEARAKELDFQWVKRAVVKPYGGTVLGWLRRRLFAREALDVEWVKSLVVRPAFREVAIAVLEDRELVPPPRLGVAWLLAMARQPDEVLSRFAQRSLLEHFVPEDFVAEGAKADRAAGIERLWSFVSGKKEPEALRRFAANYLLVHHPVIGKTHRDARALGIEPRLDAESYALARVRPLFDDERSDVRELAAALGRVDMVRWGDARLPYALAESRHKEGRALAVATLSSIGGEDTEAPPTSWLRSAEIYAMAESPHREARELAMSLIRRHYALVGDAHKLAWLMESPERSVRGFAVRLLWDRHRPHTVARDGAFRPLAVEARPPVELTRAFLASVLFGLPPGRHERREIDDARLDRALPASVAKRRLIGSLRDLALEDASFAAILVPALEAFTHASAKGEWQASLQAIAAIRARH